jgi:hypothetical protein
MFVILTNLSAYFSFAPDVYRDVTNLLDLPIDIPRDQEGFFKSAHLYFDRIVDAVNSGRSVIVMHAIPLVYEFLNCLRDKRDEPNASGWVVVSFFHEDKELLAANSKWSPTTRMNLKFESILELIQYPFIKKINIPYQYELTFDYLKDLYLTLR